MDAAILVVGGVTLFAVLLLGQAAVRSFKGRWGSGR